MTWLALIVFYFQTSQTLNNKPMFQVGWPNLRNWKFLGVGTQAHSGHTVAWTYEYKLDRCKRTWIIANAHAYIIGIHMQTCEYRKKNVDHSFCTNREKTRKLRGNQNYGESQLIPVGQFVFSRISWHCFRGTGLIYIKRIPCHFPDKLTEYSGKTHRRFSWLCCGHENQQMPLEPRSKNCLELEVVACGRNLPVWFLMARAKVFRIFPNSDVEIDPFKVINIEKVYHHNVTFYKLYIHTYIYITYGPFIVV